MVWYRRLGEKAGNVYDYFRGLKNQEYKTLRGEIDKFYEESSEEVHETPHDVSETFRNIEASLTKSIGDYRTKAKGFLNAKSITREEYKALIKRLNKVRKLRGKISENVSGIEEKVEELVKGLAAVVLIFTSVYLFSLEPAITGYSATNLNNVGNPFPVVAVFLLIGAFILLIKD